MDRYSDDVKILKEKKYEIDEEIRLTKNKLEELIASSINISAKLEYIGYRRQVEGIESIKKKQPPIDEEAREQEVKEINNNVRTQENPWR